MFIDTHTHIYLPEFDEDRNDVVDRALKKNVKHFILPNVDISTISQMKQFKINCPDSSSMAMGLHPTEVKESWQEDMLVVEKEFDNEEFVAVGEVGIDLYWDETYIKEQLEVFDTQLSIAFSKNLPVIIHCREGLSEILDLFEGRKGHIPQCVFHSFGGSVEDVSKIRKYGDHFFGINGIVTFKNSSLKNTLTSIGIDRILLETDSPYLAPVPHRGKRNESGYLVDIAYYLAHFMNISIDDVEKITEYSSRLFFNLNI